MTFPPYLFNHVVMCMENTTYAHIRDLVNDWYKQNGWELPSSEEMDLIICVVRSKYEDEVVCTR